MNLTQLLECWNDLFQSAVTQSCVPEWTLLLLLFRGKGEMLVVSFLFGA